MKRRKKILLGVCSRLADVIIDLYSTDPTEKTLHNVRVLIRAGLVIGLIINAPLTIIGYLVLHVFLDWGDLSEEKDSKQLYERTDKGDAELQDGPYVDERDFVS